MGGGNDYLIQVKGNQKRLRDRIIQITQEEQPLNTHQSEEKSRGRSVTRRTRVYTNPGGIDEDWIGLNRIINQTRSGQRGGQDFKEEHYYISSKEKDDGLYFAQGIRSHWGIENKQHWVKDVIMNEDHCRIRSKRIVSNLSLFRSGIISIFRINKEPSITQALEKFTNKIEKCMKLIL